MDLQDNKLRKTGTWVMYMMHYTMTFLVTSVFCLMSSLVVSLRHLHAPLLALFKYKFDFLFKYTGLSAQQN